MSIQNSISIAINGSIINGGGPGADFSTKSLFFDGVDEHIETSTTYSELDGQSKMSLSCWVKPNLDSNDVVIWINAATGRVISLVIYSTGMVRSQTQTSGNYASTATGAVVANTWQHIMVCMDLSLGNNNDRGRIFIDGQDLTSGNNTYSGTFETSNGTFRIGSSTVGNYYGGFVDEIALWAGQDLRNSVATIWNNGKPANLTSTKPTSWYRAGENSTFSYPQILMPEDTNKDKVSKYSLSFDGVGDYIDLGNPTELQITDLLTISLWVKMSSTTGQSQDCLISKDNGSSQRSYTLWGKTSTSSSPIAYIWNGGTNYSVQATTNIEDDNWHHVMLVYVPSTSLNIYIDGFLEGSNTTSIPASINNANQNINIGRFGNATFQTASNIDEAAIWSDNLSASANAIYNNGVPNDIASLYPTRLEGYWKLGEEAKFTDNWLVPNSALSNFSKYSFNFDGQDDYIDIGNPPSLQISGNFSISVWIKYSSIIQGYAFSGCGNKYGIYVQNNLINLQHRDSGNIFRNVTSTSTFNDNQWHHVLGVNDGTNLKLYIDGNLNNSNALGGANITSTGNARIGNISTASGWEFTGYIDEVAIWDSELSEGEVTAIYNGGKPKDLSGNSPISWWRMGEEATYDGTSNQFTIPDQGSGGNNGTSSNTMLLETLVGDAPQYYGGGISDSMDIFDRVGDAPKSKNNTVSYNMEEADIVEDTP
jgi:hypothetical protein